MVQTMAMVILYPIYMLEQISSLVKSYQLKMLYFFLISPWDPVNTSIAPIFTIALPNFFLQMDGYLEFIFTILDVDGLDINVWSEVNTPRFT